MSATAIEYYNKRFGDNTSAAFIHLVREIGEIAYAMEKNNAEHAKLEITESVALLHYLATQYGLDVNASMQVLYAKKLDALSAK